MSASDSTERYRSIVETAVDAIVTIDETGVIDSVNPATETLFGYAAEEMVGHNVSMLMSEPQASEHDGYLRRYLAGGEPRIIGIGREVVARRKDGSTFPMHLAVGQMEVDGRTMFTGVIRDLSDRFAAEEALRASEERYRAIIDTAVDGIIGIAADGTLADFNRAAERIFGYSAAEVVGRNVRMLMPEPDHSAHDGYLRRYLAGGEPRIIGVGREVVGLRKDGSTFPMHLGVSQVRHGGERRFAGIVRDMTDLRAAENEARAQRDYVAAVVESLQDGLLVRELDGTIGQVNARFCEMVGFPAEELVGAGPPFPYWPDGMTDPLNAVAPGGGEVDLTFLRRDGAQLTVLVTAAPVRGEDGTLLRYVETIKDVTARRKAQEELRRSEAAQRESEGLLAAERDAQRLKDEFLAMVSHELRTPLAAVVGYLELAMADVDDPAVRDLLEVAERNGRRLSALVRDILLVAQADAGRLSLDMRPVPLGELVSQAVRAARPSAGAKGIELQDAVAANPTMRADPDRLGQVLDNLISNAIKFSPSGGRVRVTLESGPSWVRITVADDGPGIPAEEVGRLFEPFYRARQPSQEAVPGSGLGLAVVKAIAEAHGGTVGVDTELGRGSAFRTELPLDAAGRPFAPVGAAA